ncbi:TetR family transcriptional regulator [Bacillus sp. FSL K6-3431]|uniref:TetR family transcriptional regulator n=1 Tax=Bacillus sp. FSL K6-3431 TaxID=2921500 RepID=UPI0030FBE633
MKKDELILQAAIELIKENGFEKTSISSITKKAEVAHGTFYRYFKSKNEIVPAIAELIFEDLLTTAQTRVDPSMHFSEKVECLVSVTLQKTTEYKEMLIFCYSGMALHSSFEKWEEIYSDYYDWVGGLLLDAQIKNEIDLTAYPEAKMLPKMIITSIESITENYLFSISNDETEDNELLKRHIITFLTQALNIKKK